jgi:hypothetical protein
LKPVSSLALPTEEIDKSAGKEGLFTEEVWKLIGWEVLQASGPI